MFLDYSKDFVFFLFPDAFRIQWPSPCRACRIAPREKRFLIIQWILSFSFFQTLSEFSDPSCHIKGILLFSCFPWIWKRQKPLNTNWPETGKRKTFEYGKCPRDLIFPVSGHFPYSRDFAFSVVSRHFPYSRNYVSRHFWTDVGSGPLRGSTRHLFVQISE